MSTLRNYTKLPRAVHILCLGTLINRIGGLMIIFLAIYVKEELDFGVKFAAWTVGAFGFGSMASSLVGGHLADSIGRRTVMLIAQFGSAAVLVAFPYLSSKAGIVVGVVVFAFITDMYRPAAHAMISDLVEPLRRPEAFGLMYLAINLGFSMAPPLGGFLADRSYRLLFWFDAVTAAIYGLIILFGIRETLGASDSSDDADKKPADRIGALDALVRITSNVPFMVFCAATLLIAMVYMQGLSTLPLHLDNLGFTKSQYGRVMMVNGIMIVILQLPLVAVTRRMHRAVVMAVAAVVTGIGFAMTGISVTMWHAMLAVSVWTLGEIIAAPFSPSIVSDLSPADMRGRYMGVFTMSFTSASMIGAPIGGEIMARYGHHALWWTCLAVSIVSAGLFLSIAGRINESKELQQT